MAALTALTANAAPREPRPAQPKEATAPREAGEPIMAIVSIKTQQVTFYDAEGWIFRAPVSTGVKERETPAGVFAVIEKEKDHHSTMYDDAWMPNMQRITWNGIALHGGPLPGYAASHGCIRMPYGFAEKLYDKTRIGMRIIIAPNDPAPVEFSHPALLTPNAEAIAAAPAHAEPLAREAAEAAKAAVEAKKAAVAAARETASLTSSLRKLEMLKRSADAEFASADRALAAAKTDQAKARAEDRKQKAAAKATEAVTQLDTAKANAKSKLEAAAAAKDAAKAAETKKVASAKAASDAKLALEPVSVYISRATQKLYVRRNTHKPAPDGGGEVFDATIEVPVTIRNPEKRIGTHVFTAMARKDAGLGTGGRRPALDRSHDRRRGRRQGCARPHYHPAGCARSHRADRIAAILDHRLGRAAERRDQLSHRVCRSVEQSAPGWLHNARAFDRDLRCGRQLPERRRLWVLLSARLGPPNWQCPLAGRLGLSLNATGLAVRRGKPPLRPHQFFREMNLTPNQPAAASGLRRGRRVARPRPTSSAYSSIGCGRPTR